MTESMYVRRVAGRLLAAALLLLLAVLPQAATAQEGAPVMYFGGKILTMEGPEPQYVEAVVSQGDKIAFVGTRAEAERRYPAAIRTDLKGRALLPGFIDPHMHPIVGSMILQMKFFAPYEWNFPWGKAPAVRGNAAFIAAVKQAEQEMKDPDQTLFIWGYHELAHGKVQRAELDAISKTRAIVMLQFSLHEGYLNSAAIRKYDLDTPETRADPQVDMAAGKYLEGGWFNHVMAKITPELMSPEAMADNFDKQRQLLQQGGVTTVGDMATGTTGALENEMKIYKDNYENGTTPFRFKLVIDMKAMGPVYDNDLDKLRRVVDGMAQYSSKHFYVDNTVKLFADGAFFAQNMRVLPPGYRDGHPGEWIMPPEMLREHIDYWWKNGYSFHIHTNGSGGLEEVLKNVERLKQTDPRDDIQVSIEHFGQSNADQMPRLQKINGKVSANMYYLYSMSDVYAADTILGKERAANFVRVGSAKKYGVPYTFHSDFNMAPIDPLFFVWIAANRETVNGNVMAPEERVSVYDGLRAVTYGAADNLRMQHMVGTLTPGKKADFVILETDPLAVDPKAVKDIKVLGTVFEGKPFTLD